ncbi:hypothetical protein TgHK011_010003 [Trichoderma gracile]|nr:hypothetical protein TgHK011_010003 [Trichoderma gracile]
MARQKAQTSAQRQQKASQRESANQRHQGGEPEEIAVPQFFNTTFSTHRVSPLYIGTQKLDQPRLDRLAHRLRDTLVGDVVRGVQIGLEATDTPMGQVGPLKAVTFRWFRATDVLGDKTSDGGDELSDEQNKGLWIEMRHENAAYVALLLPGLSQSHKPTASLWSMSLDQPDIGEADSSQFLHLPLLLLRMPQPLKAVIGEWLSTTFDCRVTKLNLGTRTLVNVLEGWIQETGLPRAEADLVLTLAFNAPVTDKGREAVLPSSGDADGDDGDENEVTEPGLRSMEISISASDLRRFLRAGKSLQKSKRAASNTTSSISSNKASWEHDDRERRRLAGPHIDDGWGWLKNKDEHPYPLMEALAHHLDHHMALNLFHPGVRVTQISCGGFVLSQSRIKMVKAGDVTEDLSKAAWMFVTLLGERLQSDGLSLVT